MTAKLFERIQATGMPPGEEFEVEDEPKEDEEDDDDEDDDEDDS